MNKQIDFSKMNILSSPICKNCDGIIIKGKCKGKENCPQRYRDMFGDWYQYN